MRLLLVEDDVMIGEVVLDLLRAEHYAVDWVKDGEMADTALMQSQNYDLVLLLVRNSSVNAWQVLSICAYPIIEVMFSMYRRRVIQEVSPGAPDRLHLHMLVYRRVVRKLIKVEPPQAWLQNASTAGVIVPWVAMMALVSVLVGQSMPVSVGLVIGQVLFYVAIYRRLVYGRWLRGAVLVPLAKVAQELG